MAQAELRPAQPESGGLQSFVWNLLGVDPETQAKWKLRQQEQKDQLASLEGKDVLGGYVPPAQQPTDLVPFKPAGAVEQGIEGLNKGLELVTALGGGVGGEFAPVKFGNLESLISRPARVRKFRGNRPVPTDYSYRALDNMQPQERAKLLDMATPSELRYAEHTTKQSMEGNKRALRKSLQGQPPESRLAAAHDAALAEDAKQNALENKIADFRSQIPLDRQLAAEEQATTFAPRASADTMTGPYSRRGKLEDLAMALQIQRQNYDREQGIFGGKAPTPGEFDQMFGSILDNSAADKAGALGGVTANPEQTGFEMLPAKTEQLYLHPAELDAMLRRFKPVPTRFEEMKAIAESHAKANPVEEAPNQQAVDAANTKALLDLQKELQAQKDKAEYDRKLNEARRRFAESQTEIKALPAVKEFMNQQSAEQQPPASGLDLLKDSVMEFLLGKSKYKKPGQ